MQQSHALNAARGVFFICARGYFEPPIPNRTRIWENSIFGPVAVKAIFTGAVAYPPRQHRRGAGQ